MSKKFYITTPIYYVNDRPHVGHSYTTVLADVLSRWRKHKGEEVFLSTGTDEHGAKVAQAAQKSGQTAKEFCDEKAAAFRSAWKLLDIDFDHFIRTTDPAHEAAVSRAVQTLFDQGLIYQAVYEGLYCVGCEQYKNPEDLINGKCPDHQIEPQMMKEESYFFKLSQFAATLEQRIISGEFKILPEERKNEVLSFIRSGLKDVSISRKNVSWGIPLPFDKKSSLYVWIDAFLSYLTVLGWQGDKSKPDFFPPDLQLMAKDILRVHAAIWPALLLALGLPLPQKLYAHGYFTIAGQKMSKSLGNVIWPEELAEKFGTDASRYLLMSALAYGQDGDLSWEKLKEKYNADLANGLGNLVSRTLSLAEKIVGEWSVKTALLESKEIKEKIRSYEKAMEEIKTSDALEKIWQIIGRCDEYVEKNKPWELVGVDPEKFSDAIGNLLAVLNEIAVLLKPFMPETSANILEQIVSNKKTGALFPRLED